MTDLEPAAGPQASVAPAKFASHTAGDKRGEYAYERRYLNGTPAQAVIIDSKQSQLNRCEAALAQAIADGHPTLSRIPRAEVAYMRDGVENVYSDLTLPHRIFDGHFRAGTVGGTPVTQLDAYRTIRNATPANARAVLDASPVSLVFGSWDSSRSTRQGRWRSTLVGEIIGFCADDRPSLRGGARVDPVGMRINLTATARVRDRGGHRPPQPDRALLARHPGTRCPGRLSGCRGSAHRPLRILQLEPRCLRRCQERTRRVSRDRHRLLGQPREAAVFLPPLTRRACLSIL